MIRNSDMIKRRVYAFMIDVAVLFIELFALLWVYFGLGKPLWFENIIYCVGLLFILRDIIGGRSVGRRLMDIGIKTLDDKIPSKLNLIIRNILAILFMPIDIFSFAANDKRYVDDFIKMKVVIIKRN